MPYKGRALYNLIQMNLKRNSQLEVEDWQVEDYHALKEEELFSRLEAYQIFLDKEHFLLYVDESDSPEDLTDFLYLEKDFVTHEKVFLCIFELWRRLSPHKQSLSLFCDELDCLIEEYEEGNLEHEEELQASLLSFQKVLDDHVDEGGDPLEGFQLISKFSCHDMEVFIYEYVAHQLDLENELYSSELLEGFYAYLENKRWFDFLRVRAVFAADHNEGSIMLERLFDSLSEDPDIHLLFEILNFLVHLDDSQQFIKAFHQALETLETEDDLRELMSVACDYFNCTDKEKEEESVLKLLEKRKDKSPSDPLDPNDNAFQALKELITCSPA